MSQLIIRPTGAGDETNQTPEPAVANYLNVDEATPDESTTSNGAFNSTTVRDLYTMENCGLAGGTTINWIRIYMRVMAAEGASGSAKTAIKSGGTVYEGSVESPPASYTDYYTQYTTIGGAAITPAMIDAIQGGCSLTLATKAGIHNTQIYILVDYTLSAAGKVQGHVIG